MPRSDLPADEIVDAAPDAMVVVDHSGVIRLVNQQTEILFGYPREELIGQEVETLLPVRFRNPHQSHRGQFLSTPRVRHLGQSPELYGLRKDGSEFPAEISLSPIQTENGMFVASAIRDTTERVTLSERRFRAIFEQRHQLTAIIDLSGTLLDCNQRALDFSGLASTEVIGRPFWQCGWWTHDNAQQEKLKDAIESAAGGDLISFEATHPRPSGRLASVDFSIRPVRDEHGSIAFLVPESHDITSRKEAEAALLRANETLEQRVLERVADFKLASQEAERANVGKSRFMAAASHDLRQPLQSLGLYLSVLTRQLDQPHQLDVSEKMRKSLDTMGELLDALLDISKLDGGSIVPEKRDVCLQELLDRIVVDNAQQAGNKGLKLECAKTACVVHSDPGLLERSLENFVTNAIRYTEKGSVSIECDCKDGMARISVTDTGVGMPEQDLDKIFEEYYQLDNDVRDRSKGLGLGLSIVKHIAVLLEHPIGVTSTHGEGSTFWLDVPLGEPVGATASMPSENRSVRNRMPIALLIDDDPAILDAMTMLLESTGVQVHSASKGDDALTHLANGVQPDVVISDFRLPGYNGIELLKRIHKILNRDFPAVLMTGDTTDHELNTEEMTNCTVLHKPVNTKKLFSIIHSLEI